MRKQNSKALVQLEKYSLRCDVTLQNLADAIGVVLHGENSEIRGLNTLKDADATQMSFVENPKYLADAAHTKARAVLLRQEHATLLPQGVAALITPNPYLALAKASKFFAKPPFSLQGEAPQIEDSAMIQNGAYIGFGAKIGKNVQIFAGVHIGENVQIGENTIIYPNAVVYSDCTIGANCIIHAGAVIGSDGFGFAHTSSGEHVKIYQNGIVVVEDDCEIGANSTIDRAVFGKTIIKHGVKIDNLVQIAHNCIIGEFSIIVSQVGIAGSSTLGKHVIMGGQSAVSGHVEIGDFAIIAARGAVQKSLAGNQTYSGAPIMEHRKWLKLQAKLSLMTKAK